MPQFEFATVLVPQLFWLAVIFAVLYFGVIRLTLPKLGRVMESREAKVTGDLDSAANAKAEADAMAERYQGEIAAAQEKARAAVSAAKAKGAASLEKKLAAANARLDEKLASAEAELDAARAKALSEIETVAAEAAADIVARLTGARLTPGEAQKAAADALGTRG